MHVLRSILDHIQYRFNYSWWRVVERKKQPIEKDLRCPDHSNDEYKKESSDPAVIRFVAE